MFRKIGVLGAGSWGTALAAWLAREVGAVTLWGRDPAHVARMQSSRANADYLPDFTLPENLAVTADLAALGDVELLLFVTPSAALREVAAAIALPATTVLLSCTKGIEQGTGWRMSEILRAQFPANPIGVFSGPSHAEEVIRGMPTAVVLGCADAAIAAGLQQCFTNRHLRSYTSEDCAGIELGGALKNVFAIAAGISDGLGLGDNSKAALVTRALAELVRLGVAMGGQPATFYGLSGVGDLMVTCFSRHSRNRGFGERLGRGETPAAIRASMQMVAEGVPTTRSAWECSQRLGISTPIIDQAHAILHEGKSARTALQELLTRDPRAEID